MPNLLLLSGSTVYGLPFLEWAFAYIKEFLTRCNAKDVLFIPYALKDLDGYTARVARALHPLGITVKGIHEHDDPVKAVKNAQAIFTGGGNTFRLLNLLYEKKLLDAIRKRVLEDGVPYMGSSAGTGVATCSIKTSNDMPIVYPPSFKALNLVPFNMNVHYIEHDPSTTHMIESRETRIKEFHEENDVPVLGIREGSLLHVEDTKITLEGTKAAVLFRRNQEPEDYPAGSDLSFLLNQ